ncbi:NADPH quinone oxidoreductase [Litchfieldella anticariensis FP35 = DSM 16096]|uniref:NADPH quinone oxidoreductase n=1 Tax=Litchfieldella anticariensis (strain DSM 16096 / CECT 5854 / CIP 108499 / LMG 22089 / FP35) TaxID=1121939 RepID=S2KKQ8_LITA3|nr:NAD(P)H-dependent oxidoreductase [Halomonas anticariensis]EPC01013.1 NADPH quinone oxidoreductase [Halomonas anticariensis FP35 = DSM 16096]
MHALIVYCHPEPHSFNGALKDIAMETLQRLGYSVEVSDLYAEGFDPVEHPAHFTKRADTESFAPLTEQRYSFREGILPADVQREIARLERADLVVLQFPLWWHAQPAMLKGWFDRIFVYGGIYSGSMRYDRGRFPGKRVICSVTTGAPEPTFSLHGRSGHIVSLMWPIHCSLYYLGMDVIAPQIHYGVQGGGLSYQEEESFRAQLEADKANWARRLESLEEETPIPFTGWDDWDENGVLKPEHPTRWRL